MVNSVLPNTQLQKSQSSFSTHLPVIFPKSIWLSLNHSSFLCYNWLRVLTYYEWPPQLPKGSFLGTQELLPKSSLVIILPPSKLPGLAALLINREDFHSVLLTSIVWAPRKSSTGDPEVARLLFDSTSNLYILDAVLFAQVILCLEKSFVRGSAKSYPWHKHWDYCILCSRLQTHCWIYCIHYSFWTLLIGYFEHCKSSHYTYAFSSFFLYVCVCVCDVFCICMYVHMCWRVCMWRRKVNVVFSTITLSLFL